MKKKITLLICLLGFLLFLTGCSNISNMNNDDIVETVLNSGEKKANQSLLGYKIYLPSSMTLISDNESNNILYSETDKYYLYADLISYYNKKSNDYSKLKKDDSYYYKELNYNDKKGYIIINEENNGNYYIEIVYNYAKIEVITHDIKNSLVKSLMVLNSLTYNDYVVDSLVGSNVLNYNEEEFTLKSPTGGTSNSENFLQYEEEYATDESEKELPDEDTIDITTEDIGNANQNQ